MPQTKEAAPGGVIRADAAYSLDQVRQRLGLGTAALRTARRKGLTVRRVGRRSFVLGKDLLDFLEEHATIVV
jgi:hypothetical protein